MAALYAWKGSTLPYPDELRPMLGLEVAIVFLLAIIEYARIFLGTKGKLVRRQNEIRFVVKWRQQERYGIEFDEPIDEQEMLIQIGKAERQPDYKPRFRRPGLTEKKR